MIENLPALVTRLKMARDICTKEGQIAAAILLQDAEDSIVGTINLADRFHKAAMQKSERDILEGGAIMNVRGAIDDTMDLAKNEWLIRPDSTMPEACSFSHLEEMHEKIKADDTMSYGKLCRWLGWMQATVVSWGSVSLETMKEINKRHAG